MPMATRSSHVPIPGSEYVPLAGATAISPVDPRSIISVTIVVQSRRPAPELHSDRELAGLLPRDRTHLSREEFESRHGAHADDLAQVERFARAHGFEIVESSVVRHCVVLRGSAGDFSKVFLVEMMEYDHERGPHRGTSGAIHIPKELAGLVEAVLGLHDRPCALRHTTGVVRKKATRAPFSPSDVAEIYRFPRH